MGHSADQMAQQVITAREVDVARARTAPPRPAPAPARADAGGQPASRGQLVATVPGS
jgi:hypothetical protein